MTIKKSLSLKDKAISVYKPLKKLHRDAKIELNFSNPLELMIATILSAQCTDVRVNIVTKELFKSFKTANDYVTKPISELEKIIHSAGFYRQKAKSIRGAVKKIIEEHNGKVPKTMEELIKLPGVGRKTANVILGNGYGIPGMPVDTHVRRIANRIGLTSQQDPVRIEAELCELIPSKDWTQFSHTLIMHGRRICKARKPLCENCPIVNNCDFYNS
jgi:endonuclease-3